jgi:hypothetical protein
MGDGMVQSFCILLEYSSATRESIMVAEANLHPDKLDLDKFDHNMKNWSHHVHENTRMIMGSGGHIGDSLFMHMHTALSKSHTEQFRLQLIQWATNWRQQSSEGHDWSIMQILSNIDHEYKRLLQIGQWKSIDPNSNIIALQAKLQDMEAILIAYQAKDVKQQQQQHQQQQQPSNHKSNETNKTNYGGRFSLTPQW